MDAFGALLSLRSRRLCLPTPLHASLGLARLSHAM